MILLLLVTRPWRQNIEKKNPVHYKGFPIPGISLFKSQYLFIFRFSFNSLLILIVFIKDSQFQIQQKFERKLKSLNRQIRLLQKFCRNTTILGQKKQIQNQVIFKQINVYYLFYKTFLLQFLKSTKSNQFSDQEFFLVFIMLNKSIFESISKYYINLYIKYKQKYYIQIENTQ
ncbi:hypothetical protein pb186bvf_008281 [Paramecium bursaria]